MDLPADSGLNGARRHSLRKSFLGADSKSRMSASFKFALSGKVTRFAHVIWATCSGSFAKKGNQATIRSSPRRWTYSWPARTTLIQFSGSR